MRPTLRRADDDIPFRMHMQQRPAGSGVLFGKRHGGQVRRGQHHGLLSRRIDHLHAVAALGHHPLHVVVRNIGLRRKEPCPGRLLHPVPHRPHNHRPFRVAVLERDRDNASPTPSTWQTLPSAKLSAILWKMQRPQTVPNIVLHLPKVSTNDDDDESIATFGQPLSPRQDHLPHDRRRVVNISRQRNKYPHVRLPQRLYSAKIEPWLVNRARHFLPSSAKRNGLTQTHSCLLVKSKLHTFRRQAKVNAALVSGRR